MTTLAFPTELWHELASPLDLEVETAGVIIARVANDGRMLLARSVVWVPDDAYLRRESAALEIKSEGYVPALKQAANDDGVAIFFHTHPGADPAPSKYDRKVDRQLHPLFQLRTGRDIYASLILGGRSDVPQFSGRVFHGDQEATLARVRIAGTTLSMLFRSNATVSESLYDRQIRAFGNDGQAVLQGLRVGVVGAGGTGSAVVEQLARLGVGEITVIDDDLLSETNLTRIHESGIHQVGDPKVDVASDAARRIGIGTAVHSVVGRITQVDVARALTRCDVIFGCTDDHRGRAILSRLAYWYLIPVFDTAFLVDTAAGRVAGLFGRITVVAPGTACLFCRQRIDPGQLAAEALPAEERVRLAAEGYVPGLGNPDPSVGTYTTLVGALAVAELLDRLFAFSGETPPSELLVRLTDRSISTTTTSPRPDHYCSDPSTWGRGDAEPFLEQLWT
jgi:molybdopterin/thiamine biosynthesis adenylyltransferase